jgi:hypothetical protein
MSVSAAQDSRAAPVVVLAYAGSGASRLRSLLSAFPGLACTTGTGIVPLCDQAMTAWQAVDGRAGDSPLALTSVRTFSAGLMTMILAREGGARWCELISAPPPVAGRFARLYPQARFLIVHRQAGAVVRAILDANRWGLSGPEFAPFVSAHPASTVAALASYWAVRTTQQLEFEQAYPEACHRVRAEDLTADAAQAMQDIGDFLALDGKDISPSFTQDRRWSWQAEEGAHSTGLPLDRVPESLLARVNELHGNLGYPHVTAAGAQQDS